MAEAVRHWGEMRRLKNTLDRIDRRGYGAYKDLAGSFEFDGFTLFIDRVQRDPFAPPSLTRVRTKDNRFDPSLFESRVPRVAFEDFLTRQANRATRDVARGDRGPGGRGGGAAGGGGGSGVGGVAWGASGARAGAGGSGYSGPPRRSSPAP